MTVIAVQLVSWKTGRNYGAWHIESQPRAPLCGAIIPQMALVSRQPGLLSVDDLCQSCLKAFSVSEDE